MGNQYDWQSASIAWLYPGENDRDESNLALKEEDAHPTIDSLNPFSLLSTVKAMVAFEPDLLVLPWWVMFWAPHFIWLAKALKRHRPDCRVVFICHNVRAHDSGAVSRMLTHWTLRNGDGFVVQSSRDREQLLSMFPAAHVQQVRHPVYRLYDQHAVDRDAARRALNLKGNVALFFGFVRPYKGVNILLEALPAVLQEVELETVVVGEFWGGTDTYRETLRRLGLLDRVRLVDRYIPHDEVKYWFAACDVVVLPYLEATGSGVLKLAYGCGRTAIASNVGSLGEEIVDSETGLLVTPGDAAELAAALIRFYREGLRDGLESEVIRRGRHSGWSEVVTALERLCQQPRVAAERP